MNSKNEQYKHYEDVLKIFILCPNRLRDEAKSLGAKWCQDNKKWYMQTATRYKKWLDFVEWDKKQNKPKIKHELKGRFKIKNHITIGKNYSESSDKSTPWN
ncbi:MAG: DUF5710 domain-containing protein [Candidatus Shapirobacteria bacterium]